MQNAVPKIRDESGSFYEKKNGSEKLAKQD